jgi:VIT1/CCC1 family predicted Fe2+/Mn2+ transporter
VTTLDLPLRALHAAAPTKQGLAARLNWLRAGVLGANDGIVSVAAIIVGVAGATSSLTPILVAGTAGLVGGAISMALGEYVSVSSQSDSQRSMIETERRTLAEDPAGALRDLTALYEAKGLSPATARRVAEELSEADALAAHLEAELHIGEDEVTSAWHAALASAVAFVLGAVLPLIAILFAPDDARLPVTVAAVLGALALTGAVGAVVGGGRVGRATARVVLGGALALGATFLVGRLLGASVF